MRQNALRAHTEAAIAGAVANEFSCHKQTLQEKQKIKEQERKEKMSKDMQLRDDVQEQEQKELILREQRALQWEQDINDAIEAEEKKYAEDREAMAAKQNRKKDIVNALVDSVSEPEPEGEVLKRKLDAQEEMHSILINDRIHFKPNSTNVVEESEPALDKIAQILHDNPDINVHVEGHVAVPERKRGNPKKMRQAERLSAERAESIAKELVSRGIEACRLSPVGFGGTRPLPAGQNSKRVEINVDGLNTNSTNAKQVSSEEMVAYKVLEEEKLCRASTTSKVGPGIAGASHGRRTCCISEPCSQKNQQ